MEVFVKLDRESTNQEEEESLLYLSLSLLKRDLKGYNL